MLRVGTFVAGASCTKACKWACLKQQKLSLTFLEGGSWNQVSAGPRALPRPGGIVRTPPRLFQRLAMAATLGALGLQVCRCTLHLHRVARLLPVRVQASLSSGHWIRAAVTEHGLILLH